MLFSEERRFSCSRAFDPSASPGEPGMGSRPRPVSSTGQALRGGMPSRERRFGCSRVFDPWTRSGGPGMGSRRHGNDDSVALTRSTLRQGQKGRGWVPGVTGTTIQYPSAGSGQAQSSPVEGSRRLERHARSLDRRWPGDRRCAGVRPEHVRRWVCRWSRWTGGF